MSFLDIILTAVSLSLDAVAVSVAAAVLNKLATKQAIKIATFFGIFQLLMPVLGYYLGIGFKSYLINYGNIIGFLALFGLGCKMFYEALKKPDNEVVEEEKHITNNKILTILAISTSIDAMIVGITFNFLKVNIPLAISIIGLVTFSLCAGGIYLGTKSKHLIGNKIEFVGAGILILLAFKILLF